jgi:hypothetical protein
LGETACLLRARAAKLDGLLTHEQASQAG